MKRRLPLLLLALCLLACREDDLSPMTSGIRVCAGKDVGDPGCNGPFALGELRTGYGYPVSLTVFDLGDAPLRIVDVISLDPALEVVNAPDRVPTAESAPLDLRVTPARDGSAVSKLMIHTDAPDSPLVVELTWHSIPPPRPRLVICPEGGASSSCGVDITTTFRVRRQQAESKGFVVRNDGDAPLTVTGAAWDGLSTYAGELTLAASTRPGMLGAGEWALIVVVYAPADGLADQVSLIIGTNDPVQPIARLRVDAASAENLPPIAEAHAAPGETGGNVYIVGTDVWLDGARSSDPEGDPIVFSWLLTGPHGEVLTVEGSDDAAAHFVPRQSGAYVATLMVTDSLDQTSVANVDMTMRFRMTLRTSLSWDSGGDVDLHLLAPGGTLFGEGDCHFLNPRPDWGAALVEEDDPMLVQDAESSPGHEELLTAAPAPGVYGLYAHYFEAAGAAEVTARIAFDDDTVLALEETASLSSSCELWHIADIDFPAKTIIPRGSATTFECQ